MVWRKAAAYFLAALMVFPLWAASEPLGNVTSSKLATLRDMPLHPGSTVFDGDPISVGGQGVARLALAGGGQAEVLGNSEVQLTRSGEQTQIVVERGQASFEVSGGSNLEARVANAVVRSANGQGASAIIRESNGSHAVIAALKGTLLLKTEDNGKTYLIHEGAAADLSLGPETEQGGGAVPAGQSAPSIRKKRKKILAVILISGGAIITGYLLSRRETTQPTTVLQNEVSPVKID
jgi:hypothetical protein